MKITVTEQGPYVVSDDVPLRRKRAVTTEQGEPVTWESDEPSAPQGEYELCRCGGSQNKPYCDGTHETRDWDGTCTAPTDTYDDRAQSYGGDGLVVRDDPSLCEHAGFCANRASNVWKLAPKAGETAIRSQVIGMVERCPSGRLTYEVDGRAVEPDLARSIGVVDDGPLFVTGGIETERPDGQPFETRNRMTLCRCGQSANKPLCDGSHSKVGFSDS